MKKKKIFTVFLMLTVIAVLAACGKGEALSKTFEREVNGTTSSLTYKYQNDIVIEQTSRSVTKFGDLGLTKEEVEKQVKPLVEKFKNIKGITYDLDIKDTEMIESIKLDYSKADISELRGLPGMSFDSNEDVKKISMKRSEELLKSQGYTEKK
jgi:uncharacterized lipoprotein YehR (DUF1307 family)